MCGSDLALLFSFSFLRFFCAFLVWMTAACYGPGTEDCLHRRSIFFYVNFFISVFLWM